MKVSFEIVTGLSLRSRISEQLLLRVVLTSHSVSLSVNVKRIRLLRCSVGVRLTLVVLACTALLAPLAVKILTGFVAGGGLGWGGYPSCCDCNHSSCSRCMLSIPES
jgi:hypothetical protein